LIAIHAGHWFKNGREAKNKFQELAVRFFNAHIFTYSICGGFMNLDSILSEIDLEISRLLQAKHLLSENSTIHAAVKRGPGRPPASGNHSVVKQVKASAGKPKRHTMSAAGRARIAAAQRARWAKVKKAAKKVATPAKKATAKSARKKASKPAVKKAVSAKPETAPTTAS
jgi:hypothetical protein